MSLSANARGDKLSVMLTVILVIFVPYIFYYFLTVFFDEKGKIYFPYIPNKYLFLLPVAVTTLKIIGWFNESVADFISENPYFSTPCFGIGVLLNFFALSKVYLYYRKGPSFETLLIKSIWVTLFISFVPLLTLTMIPQIIWKEYNSGFYNNLLTGSFVLFLPASFAYLIATKQIYDIHVVMRRVLVAAATALIPSIVLVAIVKLLVSGETFNKLAVMFLLFEVVIATVLYSLEYFTTKLEPMVFPRKHQLRVAIKKIAGNLKTIASFRELKEIILIDIVETIQVNGGAIVFREPNGIETIVAGHIDAAEVERLVAAGKREHPDYSCLEVNRTEEYTSYLVLTRKTTNTLLSQEEIEWLNLIVSYLAISLENVYLIRKLLSRLQVLAAQLPDEREARDVNWFRKLMFELQEKERARIAGDLHDTTMQDLYFLKHRFQAVMDNYALLPHDEAEIGNLLEYVEIITTNLRQSCFELHPYLLKDIGLVETVRRLVRLEAAVCSFRLTFAAEGTVDIELMDMEWKRNVFRIFQELINNAKKHSQAARVHLEMTAGQEKVTLRYEDDGVGFDPEELTEREIGGSGIGMEQLKSRIVMLGGHYELEAHKGSGVKLRIALPIKGRLTA